MSSFCLDRLLLGTEKHLIVSDGSGCADAPTTFSWSPTVPDGTWHFDGHLKEHDDWCLDTVARLSGAMLSTVPSARFVRSMGVLSGSFSGPVPWHKVMPVLEHQVFTRCLIDGARGVLLSPSRGYFEGTWRAGSAVLRSLGRAAVDEVRWGQLIEAGEGNVPAVRSFQPDAAGFAPPARYDRLATLTGRLTVKEGPQILTLKREHRDLLRSRHRTDGSIVSIDFAALEARVLLYEHGRRCDDVDLYGMIAGELGYDRKAVKGAIISELYGGSKHTLGRVLGLEGKELNAFVRKVRDYFQTADLLKRIKEQFIATGYLTNRYGRRVPVDEPLDHVLINYYGQSTGVDVTMLGFSRVVQRLNEVAPRSIPIFLLHDAMLIDVHNGDLDAVKKIDSVRVKGYVQSWPLRLERVA